MRSKRVHPNGDRRRVPVRQVRAVVKQIAALFNPEKIILFGSYAYGKPKPESDVDLLVVMDTSLRNSVQAAQIVRALDYHFGMDLIVRRPQQIAERIALGDSFLREITEKGKVVYAHAN
ncbi:MAG: nucleotidyltransferase domain-containing protein [Chloroflexi bacterium]|nr:nucleotidyltransferase domain-containing protein [Chloroflexota bacterium]